MDYLLKRWPMFTRLLDDGPICRSKQCSSVRTPTLSAGHSD
jgi:hypothetical protein